VKANVHFKEVNSINKNIYFEEGGKLENNEKEVNEIVFNAINTLTKKPSK